MTTHAFHILQVSFILFFFLKVFEMILSVRQYCVHVRLVFYCQLQCSVTNRTKIVITVPDYVWQHRGNVSRFKHIWCVRFLRHGREFTNAVITRTSLSAKAAYKVCNLCTVFHLQHHFTERCTSYWHYLSQLNSSMFIIIALKNRPAARRIPSASCEFPQKSAIAALRASLLGSSFIEFMYSTLSA